jgi:hypothetical protein
LLTTLPHTVDQPAKPTLPPAIDFSFTFPPTPQPYIPSAVSANGANSAETISSYDVVPAVMMAVASSVIFCSVLLYAADLRDRFRHEDMIEEHRRRRENDANSSKQIETIASSGGYWIRGERIPRRGHHPKLTTLEDEDPRVMLNHTDQPEFVDEFSISPMSTMTASLAPVENSIQRVNSDELEASIDITELSEADRVSLDTDIASLVDLSRLHTVPRWGGSSNGQRHSITTFESQDEEAANGLCLTGFEDIDYIMKGEDADDEDESGWTSSVGKSDSSSDVSIGTYLKSIHSSRSTVSSSSSHAEKSQASSTNSQELFGVGCLCDTPQKSTSGETSLDRSPDTPYSLQEDASTTRNELAQLEQVYQKPELPIQEYVQISRENSIDEDSVHQDYVRDVYFVPVAASRVVDLGIQLSDAIAADTYPNVLSVSEESPLVDRVFVGDVILAVNNEWTAGCDASKVTSMFWTGDEEQGHERADIVKLTIMSCQADGSDSESDVTSIHESFDTGDAETAIEV